MIEAPIFQELEVETGCDVTYRETSSSLRFESVLSAKHERTASALLLNSNGTKEEKNSS
jgi:hypothetical protein